MTTFRPRFRRATLAAPVVFVLVGGCGENPPPGQLQDNRGTTGIGAGPTTTSGGTAADKTGTSGSGTSRASDAR